LKVTRVRFEAAEARTNVADDCRITVAIPTYRGARHLAEALRGVLAQEGVAFDLLVSDDRSDDETLDVVRSVAGDRARVSVNSEQLGLAGNWNRCVTLCRTPLVAIFHQDDVMRPGHLAAHVAAFEARPDAGLIASATTVIDEHGSPVPAKVVDPGGLGLVDRTYEPGEAIGEMAVANPLRCSAVTLAGAAHAAAGGFDSSYRYVVDWDFWLSIARMFPVMWVARPTVGVRWHSASETHRFQTGTADLEETQRLQQRLFDQDVSLGHDLPRLRRAADHRLSRAYLNRSHVALREGDAVLARSCLRQSFALWPGILRTIALDPRLALMMTALAVSPSMAGRWLTRVR
jgi:glycosyltransferase involved in cell wall biosynthesis